MQRCVYPAVINFRTLVSKWKFLVCFSLFFLNKYFYKKNSTPQTLRRKEKKNEKILCTFFLFQFNLRNSFLFYLFLYYFVHSKMTKYYFYSLTFISWTIQLLRQIIFLFNLYKFLFFCLFSCMFFPFFLFVDFCVEFERSNKRYDEH